MIMIPERLDRFRELLDTEMMQEESNRVLLALLFTNESFALNGIEERNRLSKEHGIKSLTSDYAFTYPLKLYGVITKRGMKNIENAIEKSKNFEEFAGNLNIYGKSVVYAHKHAILKFLLYLVSGMPDINSDVIQNGFHTLCDINRKNTCFVKPLSSFQIVSGLKCNFDGVKYYGILEYLCISDIIWLMPLLKSIKWSFSSLKSMHLFCTISLIEKPTQKFMDLYVSGVKSIAGNTNITLDEYIILRMIFYLDDICYRDFVMYHKEAGVLDNQFYDEMEIWCNNVSTAYSIVKEKWKNQGGV